MPASLCGGRFSVANRRSGPPWQTLYCLCIYWGIPYVRAVLDELKAQEDDSFTIHPENRKLRKKWGPMIRKVALALVVLCLSATLIAQQTMSNDSVIKLVKAGLSDDLIISTINASPGAYDASANGLIALKSAGVSDRVVGAIVTKASAPSQGTNVAQEPAPSTAAAGTNPDDPNAPH